MIKPDITLEQLNQLSKNTLVAHLGIKITEIGQDYVTATMPVDPRTIQPFGLLHGGASVALAETLGSIAAYATLSDSSMMVVGLEINANHLRPVRDGFVTGTARPVHVGQRTQVWEIKIVDDSDKLVCLSRITLMVVHK